MIMMRGKHLLRPTKNWSRVICGEQKMGSSPYSLFSDVIKNSRLPIYDLLIENYANG